MIGPAEIRAASNSETGPQHDEVQQVDTAALGVHSMQVATLWALPRLADGFPPEVVMGACWAQGFMAGVKAARADERAKS